MRLNALSILAIGTLTGCGGVDGATGVVARQATRTPPAAPVASDNPADAPDPAVPVAPVPSYPPPPAAADPAAPATSNTPPPAAADPTAPALGAPTPSIDDSLTRLGDLNVIHVEDLLVGLPEAAYNCYGFCSDWKDEYEAAAPSVAPRLAKFVDAAKVASESAPDCESCSERVDENLAQLRALALFRVVDVIVAHAENNPNCYSLPCPEDIAAARAKNAERAAKLEAIVDATRGL